MKIAGEEVSGPNEEVLVLPRLNGDIIIRAKAVLDMDPFYAMCPEPKAKAMLVKGGWTKDTKSQSYKDSVKQHSMMRFAYIALNSLYEFEWDTVDLDRPDTWLNYEADLKNAGLTQIECNRITLCVMQANSLDEDKLQQARDSFLHGMRQEQPADTSGPETEPSSTPSGEPASD
jgi:hypothetical protein